MYYGAKLSWLISSLLMDLPWAESVTGDGPYWAGEKRVDKSR